LAGAEELAMIATVSVFGQHSFLEASVPAQVAMTAAVNTESLAYLRREARLIQEECGKGAEHRRWRCTERKWRY
jgi:hypothetical protein